MSPARRGPPRRSAPASSQQTRLRGGGGGGSGTATPAEGSATTTITSTPSHPLSDGLVLRLRGAHSPSASATDDSTNQEQSAEDAQTGNRRRIQWAEDVVDNEGLGRKKSKVCCIFHKTREVGESSSEDDSSDDSSGESGVSSGDDDGSAKPSGGRRKMGRGRKKHRRGHEHGKDCGHGDEQGAGGQRKPSPNAYEKMPKYDVKPLQQQPGRV